MALKATLDTLDGLDAPIAALYAKDETTGKFRVAVEGLVEKSKLDEFRTNNIELANKLKTYDGIDIEAAKSASDLARQVREKELIAKGDVDTLIAERVAAMKKDYDTQITTKTSELDMTKSQLSVLIIDNQVRANAIKNSVLPEAADDVLLRAKTIFKIVDGKAVAMDGDKIIYGKDGVNSLTIEEWTKSLQTSAPHLFVQSTGSGAKGGGKVNGQGQALSSQDKIAQGLADRG
jgi:hypothetical protein